MNTIHEQRLEAVAAYLICQDAELGIRLRMRGQDDPVVNAWVRMRDAIGLRGWPTTKEAAQCLKNMLEPKR